MNNKIVKRQIVFFSIMNVKINYEKSDIFFQTLLLMRKIIKVDLKKYGVESASGIRSIWKLDTKMFNKSILIM